MNPQLYKRLATINGKSSFDNSIAQSSENVNAENVKNGKLTIVKQVDIKKNGQEKSAPTVIYSKAIIGTFYVVEAVPESKYNKIWVVSAYISKNDVTQVLNADDSSTLSSKSSETPLVSPSFDESIRGNDVGNVGENVNVLQNKATSAAIKTDAAPEVTGKTDGKAETEVEMQEKSENTQEVFSGELALDEKKLMSKSDDVREPKFCVFLKRN